MGPLLAVVSPGVAPMPSVLRNEQFYTSKLEIIR